MISWRDVRNDKSIMIQTECIVSDNNSTSSDANDDFLYKVVIYLTTGKIMIQGKRYEAFCDGYFNTCLKQVNNYFSDINNRKTDTISNTHVKKQLKDDVIDLS